MNKITIAGRVGQDVEIRSTANGRVAILSVATDEGYKDRETGDWVERTQWHRVVSYQNGLIDMLERHGRKGRSVAVSGTMIYREWTREGESSPRISPEIQVDLKGEIEFLSSLPRE
ncbi:single-stranded DNA-binding protein [Aureimonas sp. N4]|uniref:single-stranded DNA-binding protein n=1 Tax=Aureimonas sp. N4 TaxID=1638165 RepID=UPI000AE51CEC|nr:single-stranded DNA-binding protein [Aureimonas sp. N4]